MSAKKKYLFHRIFVVLMLGLIIFSSVPVSANNDAAQSYIVQGTELSIVKELVEASGGNITSELELINGVVVDLNEAEVSSLLAEPEITSVFPNGNLEAAGLVTKKTNKKVDTDYPEATGSDYVTEQNITGDGVTVAILDSGIANYNSLKKDANGNSRIVAWLDLVDGKNNITDPNGHGTHLAGIIANSEIGADGSYNGIAPDVNLVVVRILDEEGHGSYQTAIEGITWVIQHKNEYNIKVINLSLTAEVQSPYWADPLNQAIMMAWAEGITVITCAGNEGSAPLSVTVPGNNPYIITVGAFSDAYTPLDWEDDYLASFSSAGPTLDAFVKPDILAPGAHMVSTMANNSYISKQHQANWIQSTRYYEMAGTSQAAATITGITALMLQQNPGLTPDQVKHRLMITSMPFIDGDVAVEEAQAAYSVFQQGAGRVNAPDAVFATDIAGEANQGMNIWADLHGEEHYQGFAIYDAEQDVYAIQGYQDVNNSYVVWDGGLGLWSGGLGLWSGGLGLWSGGLGLWSGGLGLWSGGLGLWSGGLGLWSGGLGLWSGGLGLWSGGLGLWSGGLGLWSGGLGLWSGSYPLMADLPGDLQNSLSNASLNTAKWVEE